MFFDSDRSKACFFDERTFRQAEVDLHEELMKKDMPSPEDDKASLQLRFKHYNDSL